MSIHLDDARLGKSEWLSEDRQWILFGLLVILIGLWLLRLPEPDQLGAGTFGQSVLLISVAFAMFFGLVSQSLPINTWIDVLIDLWLIAVFSKLRVLTPYLLACFASIFFLLPVQAAQQKGLVVYDYQWYSLNVLWTTGASNAFTAVMVDRQWISLKTRWVSQSLGWPILMSGIVIVPMIMGVEMEAYKLTLPETIRYSAFQASVYIFIYFGFCGHLERILPKEKQMFGAEVSDAGVIFLGVSLAFHFVVGGLGFLWLCLFSCTCVLVSGTIVIGILDFLFTDEPTRSPETVDPCGRLGIAAPLRPNNVDPAVKRRRFN